MPIVSIMIKPFTLFSLTMLATLSTAFAKWRALDKQELYDASSLIVEATFIEETKVEKTPHGEKQLVKVEVTKRYKGGSKNEIEVVGK